MVRIPYKIIIFYIVDILSRIVDSLILLKMNKHTRILLIMVVLLINISTINQSSAVPGESSDEPITIFEGITQGTLPGPDKDGGIWYSIALNGHYYFSLDALFSTDFDMGVYSDSMVLVGEADNNLYPDVLKAYNLVGDYFINVYPYSGSGDFDLNITSFVATPGEDPGAPIDIEEGITEGLLPGPAEDHSIYYNITLNGDYIFSLTGPENTDFEIILMNENGGTVGSSTSSNYPEVMTTGGLNGNYIIEIYAYSGEGAFTLRINRIVYQVGGSFYDPLAISGNNVSGNIPGPSSSGGIWYSIHLSGNYRFELTGDVGTDFDMKLYDLDYVLIDSASTYIYPEVMEIVNAIGKYIIEIYGYQERDTGSYLLVIEKIEETSTYDPFTTSTGVDIFDDQLTPTLMWIVVIVLVIYLIQKFTKRQGTSKTVKPKRGPDIAESFKQVESLKRMKICFACETTNDFAALFCEECGTKL